MAIAKNADLNVHLHVCVNVYIHVHDCNLSLVLRKANTCRNHYCTSMRPVIHIICMCTNCMCIMHTNQQYPCNNSTLVLPGGGGGTFVYCIRKGAPKCIMIRNRITIIL